MGTVTTGFCGAIFSLPSLVPIVNLEVEIGIL